MPFAIALLVLGAAAVIGYAVSQGGGLGGTAASAAAGAVSGVTGGATGGTTAPSTLSPKAKAALTSDQQTFAATLASDTGLNVNVVSGWLLAEESGGAAQARQSANNNDWLNIGYTGSGTFGASDSIWSDPTTAANATAAWLKGQNSIPGYGVASQGIQNILNSAGKSVAAQIAALQTSGWAGSGYTTLPSIVQSIS